MGMYNGVQSTYRLNPYELRHESIRNLFLGEHEIEDYYHHWGRCKV